MVTPETYHFHTLAVNLVNIAPIWRHIATSLCSGPVPPQMYSWKRPAAAAKPPLSAPASTAPPCRPALPNPPQSPPTPAHRDPLSASMLAVIKHPLGQGPQAVARTPHMASSSVHSAMSLPLPPGFPLAEAGEIWNRVAAHKGPLADKTVPEMAARSAGGQQLPMPPTSSGYEMVFHPYRTGNTDSSISSLACAAAPGDSPSATIP
jgi:hypothetical protein